MRDHENYTRGLIWTLQNHPRIPAEKRKQWSRWGLAKDEFADNGNWPFQLYVREARRMEPTYMILGQSAATAASLAIKGDLAVQDVPYAELRGRLEADGQRACLIPESFRKWYKKCV